MKANEVDLTTRTENAMAAHYKGNRTPDVLTQKFFSEHWSEAEEGENILSAQELLRDSMENPEVLLEMRNFGETGLRKMRETLFEALDKSPLAGSSSETETYAYEVRFPNREKNTLTLIYSSLRGNSKLTNKIFRPYQAESPSDLLTVEELWDDVLNREEAFLEQDKVDEDVLGRIIGAVSRGDPSNAALPSDSSMFEIWAKPYGKRDRDRETTRIDANRVIMIRAGNRDPMRWTTFGLVDGSKWEVEIAIGRFSELVEEHRQNAQG